MQQGWNAVFYILDIHLYILAYSSAYKSFEPVFLGMATYWHITSKP